MPTLCLIMRQECVSLLRSLMTSESKTCALLAEKELKSARPLQYPSGDKWTGTIMRSTYHQGCIMLTKPTNKL